MRGAVPPLPRTSSWSGTCFSLGRDKFNPYLIPSVCSDLEETIFGSDLKYLSSSFVLICVNIKGL
jgi:hypothetical protein